LYPTEDKFAENSEWIVAWHHLQTIKQSLKFLREMVAPNTASAVMAQTDIAKMFDCAADFIRDRLKKFPQDRRLLRLPALKLDDSRFNSVDVSSSSDSDYLPLPAGRMRVRVPHAGDDSDDDDDDDDDVHVIGHPRPRPLAPPPGPEERPQLWQRFEDVVQFVMDSCNVNRRAATDALFAHDRNPEAAIGYLLQ
jgi:hypothetical protein